jgi:hypothetical protein
VEKWQWISSCSNSCISLCSNSCLLTSGHLRASGAVCLSSGHLSASHHCIPKPRQRKHQSRCLEAVEMCLPPRTSRAGSRHAGARCGGKSFCHGFARCQQTTTCCRILPVLLMAIHHILLGLPMAMCRILPGLPMSIHHLQFRGLCRHRPLGGTA